MKGDFSRLTFAEENHYRRVLMQQGRVELDADANEQIAIDGHIAAATSTDVIGQAGYPLGTLPGGAPAGGFALALNATGTDLEISPGRMYVDGLLAENDTPGATLLTQPDLPGVTLDALGAAKPGFYLVYLDVWERLITALDNPAIRETALGGPDTSVRAKLVWQVKLAYLGPVRKPGAPLPTCSTAGKPWPAPSTGMLAAGTGEPGSDLPCVLPPETGYQRLENQLYRVEIHAPGQDGTATFKWSRENGSVVALIAAPPAPGGTPPATVTGPTFWVTSLSDDLTLGLQAQDWVELTDDSSELLAGSGTLYQVAATPTDGHTVTLSGGSTTTVDLSRYPKLRRWDQSGADASLGQGIPVTTGAPIPLEGGVQVQFAAGTYQVGDYWLIPARTATSVQQGYVEWPVDAASNPVPQPPRGIRHHYAQLGLVELTAGGTFGGLGPAAEPTDCRLPFLPLTGLMPAQSLSPCTIVVRPGPGWEQPVLDYFQAANADGARLDAEICFPVGDFPLTSQFVISGAGHVRVNGAGWGTRLIAGDVGAESALVFSDCLSVGVRDLYAESSEVISGRVRAGRSHISGTLEFWNCGDVSVEGAWLRCGSAISTRGAACVTVGSDVVLPDPNGASAGNVATGAGSVRIRDCRLYVGEMQVGIQLVHQARASVEDNVIVVDPGARATTLDYRLADRGYLAVARGYLISQVSLAPAPATTEGIEPPTVQMPIPTLAGLAARTNIHVNVGNQVLRFATTGNLQSTWQAYLDEHAPSTFGTQADALRYVKSAATTILTTPSARAGLSGFGSVVHILAEHVPLAGRGIVVGGQAIGDLQITGNSISGVLLGISAGVSHRASAAEEAAKQRTPDHLGTVRITGNEIDCGANDLAIKNARFGVFVGSARSLTIEDNRLTSAPAGISAVPPADGIRVVGYLGGKAVIRANYLTGFAMGIRVVPLQGNGPGTRAQAKEFSYVEPFRFGSQWLVADNAIEGASRTAVIGPFWPTKPPAGSPAGTSAPLPSAYVDAPACLRVNNAIV